MRLFLLLLALASGLANPLQARDLQVALGVQDAAQPRLPADANRGAAQAGGLTGFNEALAREICRRISARCSMVYLTFAEILPAVEAGRVELGFGNYLRTAEREKRVTFSEAVWHSSSRLLAKPTVAARLARKIQGEVTLDSLRGTRVAVVDGTLQHAYLRSIASARALTVMPLPTLADVLAALRQDKADFLLMPMLSAYALISREPPGSFDFVGPPIIDRGLGGSVHVVMPKQNEEMVQAVNQAIIALRADGTYQRIVRRYFPFSLD